MESGDESDEFSSDFLDALGIDDFIVRNECPRGLGPSPQCSGSQEEEIRNLAKCIRMKDGTKSGKARSSKALSNGAVGDDDEDGETVDNFDLLSKPRVIVHRGNVDKKRDSVVKATSSKRKLYLLNDLILVTSKSTGYFSSSEQISVHHIIYLDQISIVEFSAESPRDFGIFVTTTGEQYHFIAENESERRIWVEETERAVHAIFAAKPFRAPGWHLKVLPGSLWAACFLNDGDTLRKHIRSLQEEYDMATSVSKLNEPDASGMMPLHWAAFNGYLACVKELVEAGATVDTLNSGLNTPLMIAASRGYDDVVDYLVKAEADIQTRNLKDRDALFMAVLYAYRCRSLKYIIECLKKRSEELGIGLFNQQDSAGCAPLHECAARNLSWAVQLLVDAGADVNLKHGRNGLTPLQMACSLPDPNKETVRAFLDKGAHPNWCDASGRTAFNMAVCKVSTAQNGMMDAAQMGGALKTHFLEYTFPVLMEIVKKGGRYLEEEIQSLPSSSAKVSLDETRFQWLQEGQPSGFLKFVSGRSLYKDEKLWKPDRSSNSCNLCLGVFQFMTRHHCRHCGLLCCGLCTSKRLVLCEVSAGAGPSPGRRKKRKEGEPERVCDGCFNKLRFDCLEAENRERELAKLVESSVKLSPRPGADNGQGGNLFAGAISAGATAGAGAGASGGAGGGPSTSSRAKSGVASTTAVMQDALQSLNERGERLNQLQERSEAMSQAANDFYRVAKLLADSKRRSAERFWI